MHVSFTTTIATLVVCSSVFGAPVHVRERRGVLQYFKQGIQLASDRGAPEVASALSHIKANGGSLAGLTQGHVDALLGAASKGDSKVIGLLNKGVNSMMHSPDEFAKVASNGEGSQILNKWMTTDEVGNIAVSSPFKATKNKVADAISGWKGLSTSKKMALVTAGGVGGSGAVLASALGLAGAASDDDDDEENSLPTTLSDEDMTDIENYIAANPDQYQAIMADIEKQVTGLTSAQKKELLAAAPEEFIDEASSQEDD